MNEKEGINILPVVGGGSNTDTATAMAMMNNNPWMYLVMLALNKLCDKDKMFNIRDYFKL